VYATYDSCTEVIVADAVVDATVETGSDLSGGDVMVTLAVAQAEQVLAIVHAAQRGAVTLAFAGTGPESLCSPVASRV
jgi:sarcosine oxidase gamma subunit